MGFTKKKQIIIYLILMMAIILLPFFKCDKLEVLVISDNGFGTNKYSYAITYQDGEERGYVQPINGYLFLQIETNRQIKNISIKNIDWQFSGGRVVLYNRNGTLCTCKCDVDDGGLILCKNSQWIINKFCRYNWRLRLKCICYISVIYLLILCVLKVIFNKKEIQRKHIFMFAFLIVSICSFVYYDNTICCFEVDVMENSLTCVSGVVDENFSSMQSFHTDIAFDGIGIYLARYDSNMNSDYVLYLYKNEKLIEEAIIEGKDICDNRLNRFVFDKTFEPGDYCFGIRPAEHTTDTLVIWEDTTNPYIYGSVIYNNTDTDVDWAFCLLAKKIDVKGLVWIDIRILLLLGAILVFVLSFFYDLHIWENYFLFGIVGAIILAVMQVTGPRRYELYFAVGSLLVALISDQAKNFNIFLVSHKLILVWGVVLLLYYLFVLNKRDISNYYGLICVFCLVLAGYVFYAKKPEIKQEFLFEIWILLNSIIACGVLFYYLKLDPIGEFNSDTYRYFRDSYRLIGPFVHPTLCAGFIMFTLFIGLLVIRNKVIMLLTGIVHVLALLLTGTRMAWIALIICFILFAVRCVMQGFLKKIKGFCKNTIYLTLLAFTILTILFMAFISKSTLAIMILDRITNIFDAGSSYRVFVIKTVLRHYMELPVINKLLGKGTTAGYSVLWNDPEYLSLYPAGQWPVDNAYLSVLYDFGIIGVLAIIIVLIKAIRLALDRNFLDEDTVYGTLIIACSISMISYDMLYFTNISYILFFFVGCVLAVYDKRYGGNKQ